MQNILNPSRGLISPLLLINKLIKKLPGISLEVYGITFFISFPQDMVEVWCIDLLDMENSPNAELARLFSLTKTGFDKNKLTINS